MSSFSSLGIGLGGNVDVNGLIKASVDAVKMPITEAGGLQQQATITQAKVSAFGQLKSMVSTLSDALGKLTSVTGWNGVTATSSKNDVISATAVGGAAATSFSVEVQNLAKAQTTISSSLQPSGQAVGAGTLKLEAGTWAGSPQTFTAGSASPVSIDVSATDTLSDIAGKINGASGAGVTATILNDANGERLMLTSKSTGDAAGFRLSVTNDADGSTSDNAGLSRLVNGATTTYGSNANGKPGKIVSMPVNVGKGGSNIESKPVNVQTQNRPIRINNGVKITNNPATRVQVQNNVQNHRPQVNTMPSRMVSSNNNFRQSMNQAPSMNGGGNNHRGFMH